MADTDELCPGYKQVYGLLLGFIGQLTWVVCKALKLAISSQNHVFIFVCAGSVYGKYKKR